MLGVHSPGGDALAGALTRHRVPVCVLPLLAGSSRLKMEIGRKCRIKIYHFLTSPNCQTGHSQSHVTILKRPGDRETSHDQPQSPPQILCVSYIAASFLCSKCDPDYCWEMASFSKELEPFEFIPIPSSTLDSLLFLNEH